MLQAFGYISGILATLCYVPYIRDILKGTTKPERASWTIWTLLGLIAFFSQLASGADDSLWLTGMETLGVCIVLLLALRFGAGGLARRDVVALALAAVGLGLWYATSNAAVALFIVIAIDAVGAVLTIYKAYKDPASETFSTWFLAGLAGVFACLAVGVPNFILLAYPLYIFVMNVGVCVAMIVGRRKTAAVK